MKTVKNTCLYEDVNRNDELSETDNSYHKIELSYGNMFRQILVSSTMWTLYFLFGLLLGAPTVIIPQLQKEANSSTIISEDLGSWIITMNTVKNTCNYEEVCINEDLTVTDKSDDQKHLSYKNIIRQVLVCSTVWTLYFFYGLLLGAPTVIIPQLQKEANSSMIISDDLGSWITSMFPVGAVPWTLVLPFIMHNYGGKKTYIFISLVGLFGNLIIYFSKTITHILIGEFVLGILLGSHHTISPFIISEYSSPKYRGIFLTIKSASGYWGIWVANIIGTYSHWKNIYIMAFLCNIYTLTVFIWPESPYWLAKQRRFADCEKTYLKIKGTSKNSKKDLDDLINSYKFNEDEVKGYSTKLSILNSLTSYFKLLTSKTFYGPLLTAIFLELQFYLFGKLICSIYAIQILKKITQNDAMAYKAMLILDGVTVFSTYCGCVASRYCKRRSLFFSTSFVSNLLLYVLSLYLFLVHKSIIIENNIISISILSLFSVTVCCGPAILFSSIYGELISFKHQRSSAIIYGIVGSTLMFTTLKTSPFLFKQLTLPGSFLFFAICSTISTIILFLYLPETKNKSCHEIENYFK